MTSAALHTRVLDGLLALVWAPRCAACDQLLSHPTLSVVCDACWRHIRRLTPPLCRRCGAALAASLAPDERCASCHSASGLSRRRAAGLYEGTLRAIIHAYK